MSDNIPALIDSEIVDPYRIALCDLPGHFQFIRIRSSESRPVIEFMQIDDARAMGEALIRLADLAEAGHDG